MKRGKLFLKSFGGFFAREGNFPSDELRAQRGEDVKDEGTDALVTITQIVFLKRGGIRDFSSVTKLKPGWHMRISHSAGRTHELPLNKTPPSGRKDKPSSRVARIDVRI